MVWSSGRARFGRVVAVLGLAGAVAGWPLLALPSPAAAATVFVVTSTEDPGDGSCLDGNCTLREAIEDANNTPGPDTIRFEIPGPGPHTINAGGQFRITERVTIDGYSEPGATENTAATGTNAKPQIELSFNLADGLVIAAGADGTEIRGLVINGANDGIFVGADNVTIAGNFLGTDPTGRFADGNSEGVAMNGGQGLTVGGPDRADRNLISGNDDAGVRFTAQNALVQGNLIGTDRTGKKSLGNGEDGILVDTNSANARVFGNVVAFNGEVGVDQFDATGVRILSNSIFANGGPGIGSPGPEAPRVQVASAEVSNQGTEVRGSVVARANSAILVQLFNNPKAAGAEGKTFLVQKRVRTDAAGRATFNVRVPKGKGVQPGQAITATATAEATGDTSAFSAPRTVREERGRGGRAERTAARPRQHERASEASGQEARNDRR